MKEINYGTLASITGRYYAMDRDKRWERIRIAVEGLTNGGDMATDALDVGYWELLIDVSRLYKRDMLVMKLTSF